MMTHVLLNECHLTGKTIHWLLNEKNKKIQFDIFKAENDDFIILIPSGFPDYDMPLDLRIVIAHAIDQNADMIHVSRSAPTLLSLPQYIYGNTDDDDAIYIAVKLGGFYIPAEQWPQDINKGVI